MHVCNSPVPQTRFSKCQFGGSGASLTSAPPPVHLGGTQKKLLRDVVSLSKNSPLGAREGMGAKPSLRGHWGQRQQWSQGQPPPVFATSPRVHLLI